MNTFMPIHVQFRQNGQFLGHQLIHFCQEETVNLNNPVTIERIELLLETFPQRKAQVMMVSVVTFTKSRKK